MTNRETPNDTTIKKLLFTRVATMKLINRSALIPFGFAKKSYGYQVLTTIAMQ